VPDDRDPSSLRRLWAYAADRHGRVRLAALWSALDKVFDLAPPFLIGLAIDVVANQSDSLIADLGVETARGQLVVIGLLTFIVWGLESTFDFLAEVAWRNLAQDVQHDLRVDTYRHIQTLEHGFFERRQTGDLQAVLNDDVNQLERFLDVGANELVQLVTTVVVIGTTFFIIAPQVAWWSFLPVPVVLWGAFWFQRRLEPRYADVRGRAGMLNASLGNRLLGMATVKSFGAEQREAERIAEESDAYRQANRRAIRLSSAFIPLIRMAIVVGFIGTLVYGGFLAVEGDVLSVGQYSVMVFLTQRLLWPLTRLGETFDLYQRAMASTARILDVIDTEPTIVDGPGTLAVARGAGHVRFDAVTFAYGDRPPALIDLDLDVPAGRTTAVVGATGAGKTTLVKLLLRFYEPDEGRVTIDGCAIGSVTLPALRSAIGLVSQDTYLFHGTVRDNIAYGRPEADEADIVAAAEASEVHSFVAELPDGYDTVVGERGQKLSGGQRQRLAIARAVLKDPAILVLDEATSSVDNETEAAIQRSLARIAVGRTTLVIAHRLSTVRHADRIHVMAGGRVTESGTHDELVTVGGRYAALWAVQTGEADLDRPDAA
jgi:ATP-binding cassette subfamily B protein